MNPDPHAAVPNRDETDESLQAERDKVDSALAENRARTQQTSDEVVKAARDHADELVQDARDKARDGGARRDDEGLQVAVDQAIEGERIATDAAFERERAKQRRPIDAFLAVERDQTDEHLHDERVSSDLAIAARDEFLGMVSHDLRNFLTGIALTAAQIDAGAPGDSSGDKLRKSAATTTRLVARMNRLINDLLDVTAIEAGKLVVFPQPGDVPALGAEVLELFREIIAAKGLEIEVACEPSAERASFDHDRILQVLANLLSNAIKFTRAPGKLALRVTREGAAVRFAVSDTGVGIALDQRETIFERFRQIALRDRRGLGLGLHISKFIVEGHGGTIWVDSTVGVGSTFCFTLPDRA